jgi:hypothetical protein
MSGDSENCSLFDFIISNVICILHQISRSSKVRWWQSVSKLTAFILVRTGTGGGPLWTHTHRHSPSIKCWKFTDSRTYCQFLKKGSDVWVSYTYSFLNFLCSLVFCNIYPILSLLVDLRLPLQLTASGAIPSDLSTHAKIFPGMVDRSKPLGIYLHSTKQNEIGNA